MLWKIEKYTTKDDFPRTKENNFGTLHNINKNIKTLMYIYVHVL